MTANHPKILRLLGIVCGCAFAAASSQLQASGFALIEQSVSGMGTAYAGGAAQAEDASTVYFNPAGLTRLSRPEAIAAIHGVAPQAKFHERGSLHLLGPAVNLGTRESGDARVAGVVPNLYYARPLSERLSFGLGINAPFGLSTQYSKGWIGRYHAVKSEVMTININPSLALKISDQLSIGAGINAQYIEAELTNSIDFGTINALPLALGGFGGAFNALGLAPAASDGFVKLEGDDWSWGYNLGLLFDLNDQTRLGLQYRSKIRHTLRGDADFTVPGGGLIEAGTGLFRDTDVKSTVTLPATASASLYHAYNDQWAVMADITWTNWQKMQELRFEFENPLQPDGVTTLKWKDSFRYALGIEHTPSGRWAYRTGIAFDETPVPNSRYRTPRIPDEDRTWIAFGVGYQHSDTLSFDVGYAHLFIKDPKIRKTAAGEDAVRGGLNGDYDSSVDMLSAQLKWRFL